MPIVNVASSTLISSDCNLHTPSLPNTKGAFKPPLFYLYLQLRCNYTEKEEPHPQVVAACGLRITNCEPCKLS